MIWKCVKSTRSGFIIILMSTLTVVKYFYLLYAECWSTTKEVLRSILMSFFCRIVDPLPPSQFCKYFHYISEIWFPLLKKNTILHLSWAGNRLNHEIEYLWHIMGKNIREKRRTTLTNLEGTILEVWHN